MLRKDLLEKNAAIFEQQGRVLNDYAKKSVKVLVVGNPANTNALICMHTAPDLPRENFTALTRLDLNRCVYELWFSLLRHRSYNGRQRQGTDRQAR